jgi:hypothetical protein
MRRWPGPKAHELNTRQTGRHHATLGVRDLLAALAIGAFLACFIVTGIGWPT